MAAKRMGTAFDNWNAWGLPAFASALAPWQDKISNASLISDWYQPNISITASVVAPLVCFSAFYVLKKTGSVRLGRLTKASLGAFLTAILFCLILYYTLDNIWYPGPEIQVIIRIVWSVLYLGIFIFFGIAMVGAMLLAKK
jgi:hypothetical protein